MFQAGGEILLLDYPPMKPSSELLHRCCRDDRKAHFELYKMCFAFILSVCRRYYINREDTESAINHVFLKLITGMPSYLKKDGIVPFELWVRRIAVNHVVDEYRKNKKHRELIDSREIMDFEPAHPVDDPRFSADRLEEIRHAISQLSEMNRAVFNLFVVDGYRHEEIAAMLGISPGTSKVHLHRAKKQLREMLDRDRFRNATNQVSLTS